MNCHLIVNQKAPDLIGACKLRIEKAALKQAAS